MEGQDEESRGLAEGPAGKADKGEKGRLRDEEMGKKKSNRGGIAEKSRLLWDGRLWEA